MLIWKNISFILKWGSERLRSMLRVTQLVGGIWAIAYALSTWSSSSWSSTNGQGSPTLLVSTVPQKIMVMILGAIRPLSEVFQELDIKVVVWGSFFFHSFNKHRSSIIYQAPQLGNGAVRKNMTLPLTLYITQQPSLCFLLQSGAQLPFAHSQSIHGLKGIQDAHVVWPFPKQLREMESGHTEGVKNGNFHFLCRKCGFVPSSVCLWADKFGTANCRISGQHWVSPPLALTYPFLVSLFLTRE